MIEFIFFLIFGTVSFLVHTQIRVWCDARRKAKRAEFDKKLFEDYQKRNSPALWAMNHPDD